MKATLIALGIGAGLAAGARGFDAVAAVGEGGTNLLFAVCIKPSRVVEVDSIIESFV